MWSPITDRIVAIAATLGFAFPAWAQDCNLNGVPDDQEIRLFMTADCDGNGIPDECELTDCCVPHDGSSPGGCSPSCSAAWRCY